MLINTYNFLRKSISERTFKENPFQLPSLEKLKTDNFLPETFEKTTEIEQLHKQYLKYQYPDFQGYELL